MTAQVKFMWDKQKALARMRGACDATLNDVAEAGHQFWVFVAPVGKSTKTHEAGELRDSWFAFVIETPVGPALIFGSSAPYAIFVEWGTGRFTPRMPIRRTAASIFPMIEPALRRRLAA